MPWPRDYEIEDEDEDEFAERYPASETDSGTDRTDDSDVVDDGGPLAQLGALISAAPLSQGDLSFGGGADFLPSAPGLVIKGVGRIALPLVEPSQAEAIMRVCEQAPFGRGHETLVDTEVRNSWQLDPEKITLENPEWENGIAVAEKFIAYRLGVEKTPIMLHLYKFLLYKEGGHFSKHRDTEKADRMFATMVVQLPSVHEGGTLLVYKDGTEHPVAHDFGAAAKTSHFKCHYAVHYADAEHAVVPITQGFRLALVYSLCWPESSHVPVPSMKNDLKSSMVAAMAELARGDRQFHYFLEHDYTSQSIAELGAAALKGTDRSRVAALRAMNEELPAELRFGLYIAKAELHTSYHETDENGYRDDTWEETQPENCKIKELLTLNGTSLGGRLYGWTASLENKNLLNPDQKSSLALWHGRRTTTYEGSLGNEGMTKDTTYHKYIVIAWPLRTLSISLTSLLGKQVAFRALMTAEPTDEAQVEEFLQELVTSKDRSLTTKLKKYPYMHAPSLPGHPALSPSQSTSRHYLFNYVMSKPARERLIKYYLDIFPTSADLVDDGEGWMDMDRLVTNERVWVMAKDKIASAFQGDIRNALKLIKRLLVAKVSPGEWRVVTDMLLQSKDIPPLAELNDMELQRQLWLVSSKVEDVASYAVARYMKTQLALLDGVYATLVEIQSGFPKNYESIRAAVAPLVKRRTSKLLEEVATLQFLATNAKEGRFPHAELPGWPGVETFLRGSQRTMLLRDVFYGIRDAREFSASYKTQKNCSFHSVPNGTGRNAFVTITKTTSFAETCDKKCVELRRKLATMQPLLPQETTTVEASVAPAVMPPAQQEEEHPAKRQRTHTIIIDLT